MFWNLPAPPWFPIYLSLKVAGLATLMALITGVAVARCARRPCGPRFWTPCAPCP